MGASDEDGSEGGERNVCLHLARHSSAQPPNSLHRCRKSNKNPEPGAGGIIFLRRTLFVPQIYGIEDTVWQVVNKRSREQ